MQCDGYNNNKNTAKDDSQNDGGQCQVQNWCVCQWVFASYVEAAGGCDFIQDVSCESINAEAVKAYMFGGSRLATAYPFRCNFPFNLGDKQKYMK